MSDFISGSLLFDLGQYLPSDVFVWLQHLLCYWLRLSEIFRPQVQCISLFLSDTSLLGHLQALFVSDTTPGLDASWFHQAGIRLRFGGFDHG